MSSGPKPGRRAGPCIGKPSLQRRTEGISCVFDRPGCEIRILQVDGDKPVLLLDLRHDGFYHQHLELPFVEGKLKRRRSRMGLRPPSPFGWRTLVRCPTALFPLSLLSVGGRKATAVEQKPWRRCLLPSVEPVEAGGIFRKLKCAAGPNREQRHPPPRRRALGVLVRVDGVWSAGLTGGQHRVRTLQGRIDCVPTHAACWRRKDGL